MDPLSRLRERGLLGRTLSVSLRSTALPKGEPLAEPASFVHTGQRQKKSTDKPINFTPLPKPPPEWKDFPRPGEDVAARRQKGAVAFRKAK